MYTFFVPWGIYNINYISFIKTSLGVVLDLWHSYKATTSPAHLRHQLHLELLTVGLKIARINQVHIPYNGLIDCH